MPDAERPGPALDPVSDRSLAAAQVRTQQIEAQITADPTAFRVMTGDRPTGRLHLGHYLGTLRNRVRLQNLGVQTMVLVADYQVITDRDDLTSVSERVHDLVTDYLAVGIDPQRSTIYAHSAVPGLNQLMLPFLSLVTDSELRRNPTVKAEHEATGGRPMSGLLLTYPVHQAADILFCKANVVPVGKDQLPHLEQTRVVARRFNERYAAGEQIFPAPDALLSATVNVLGTDGHKMSKSRKNTIELGMSADQTAKQLKRAVTDSDRHITYDPDHRPEVASLLQIAATLTGQDPVAIADQIGDGGGGGLKQLVIDVVNDHLAPIRRRRAELAADPGYVRSVLHQGNTAANEIADATLAQVRDLMGMTYA
ncbi:MAG: tryptophan--tRNA ligase [Beutenbergiaceae bacterium]